jgi:hypothetical protein
MHHDHPSRAAVALAAAHPKHLEALLEEVLPRHGYRRHVAPLPRGYRPADGEWLGLVLTRSDDLRMGLLIPEDLSAVFQLALWITGARPDLYFLAWRRYRGMAPVMKVYADGQPQYRDGDDDDVELTWNLPRQPGLNLVTPAEAGLPADALALEEAAGSGLAPYPEQLGRLGPEDRTVAWLHKSSPLP